MKTGGAAVVVTILFGIAAYRAAEWTKASGRESAVTDQKQPVTPESNSLPAGATAKVIPQMVIGSFDGGLTKYSTVIEVVNTASAEATVDFSFYKEDGTASSLILATNSPDHPTFTGSLAGFKLAGNSVLVISGGSTAETTPSSGIVGWARLAITGRATIGTFFEVRDGRTGLLDSRVGVPASRPDLANFVIPRMRTKSGLDVAFALVNTGSASAAIAATLKDASGATVAKRVLNMTPGAHQALFAHEFFGVAKETDDRTYQYILFNSNSRSFAAIALAFEGSTQTSFPVEPVE